MRRARRQRLRTATATLLVAFLVPTSTLANAASEDGAASQEETSSQKLASSDEESPNPAAVAFDAAILRPIGFVNLAVGAVAFIPVAVLAGPGGGLDALDQALELLVREPARAVFERPLGMF